MMGNYPVTISYSKDGGEIKAFDFLTSEIDVPVVLDHLVIEEIVKREDPENPCYLEPMKDIPWNSPPDMALRPFELLQHHGLTSVSYVVNGKTKFIEG